MISHPPAERIAALLLKAGASDVYFVGGAVRDSIRDSSVQLSDVDIEVHGMTVERIAEVLDAAGISYKACGKAFGVLKSGDVDISVPRRENKVGVGHRDFAIEMPDMTISEALSRRDFTVNAIAFSIRENRLIDPFGGVSDLDNRILRQVSDRFVEDPLRVLRGAQMAARFGLTPTGRLLQLCASMDLSSLSKERLWREWQKIASSPKPSRAIEFLDWCGHLPPQIKALKGVQQDPVHHPEGNVYTHTLHVIDSSSVSVFFAALCHDFGKPATTEFSEGRWRAKGHPKAGVEPTIEFMQSIGAPYDLILKTRKLVAEHLVHAGAAPTPRAVRRLAERLFPATMLELSMLVEADLMGRPPLTMVKNPMDEWLRMSEDLGTLRGPQSSILRGKDVIDFGIPPGPQVGEILSRAKEAQLDGIFTDHDGAVEWLRKNHAPQL